MSEGVESSFQVWLGDRLESMLSIHHSAPSLPLQAGGADQTQFLMPLLSPAHLLETSLTCYPFLLLNILLSPCHRHPKPLRSALNATKLYTFHQTLSSVTTTHLSYNNSPPQPWRHPHQPKILKFLQHSVMRLSFQLVIGKLCYIGPLL